VIVESWIEGPFFTGIGSSRSTWPALSITTCQTVSGVIAS
jgi:hypothetical protein